MEGGPALARCGYLHDLAVFDCKETDGAVLQEERRMSAEDRVVFGGFVLIEEDERFPVALGDEGEGMAGRRGICDEDLVEVGNRFVVDEGALAGGGLNDVGDMLAVGTEAGGGDCGISGAGRAVDEEGVFGVFGGNEKMAGAVGAERKVR